MSNKDMQEVFAIDSCVFVGICVVVYYKSRSQPARKVEIPKDNSRTDSPGSGINAWSRRTRWYY